MNTKDVAVNVIPSGTPAEGYEITSITCNPATVSLKGDKALLNMINLIEIPAGVVSVEGAQKNITASVDITQYIPRGITLLNAENATVQIVVEIKQRVEKTYNLETSNIMVTGLPTGGNYRFELESVAVKISGLEADLNNLSSALHGSIDVTGLKSGIHEVDLVLDIDGNKYTYQPVKLKIAISDSVQTGTGMTTTPEDSQIPEDNSDEEKSESNEGV